MRRGPVVAGAVLLVAAVAPLAFGYITNELAIGAQAKALAARLPPKTEVLKPGAGMDAAAPGCVGVAAQMLASELKATKVAEFFGSTQASLAWRRGEAFLVQTPSAEKTATNLGTEPPDALPAVVRKLLIQHAFLPHGVRRVVLFDRVPLPSSLDPRCW